jgi:hypothetical protein
MINVGVGENHHIYLARVKGKLSVSLKCLFASALEKATIEQYPGPIDFQ